MIIVTELFHEFNLQIAITPTDVSHSLVLKHNELIVLDEFAVQTCFLGRYGPEVGSDEFGAMIMVSHGDNTTNGNGKVVVRLSNVEVSTCSCSC